MLDVKVVKKQYFEWLYKKVHSDMDPMYTEASFDKMCEYMHNTKFRWLEARDINRAKDGMALRVRFASSEYPDDLYMNVIDSLAGPCSVFEMLVALAIRIEEQIMDNPEYGNRTCYWYHYMLESMGIQNEFNKVFDKKHMKFALNRMMDRTYEPDGTGGLFKVRGIKRDLRKFEIWYQMNWYLATIT